MNSLTSPDLLDQVNPNNKRLQDDFLNYMRSMQRSEGTIYQYSHDLDIFWVWNLQNNGNKDFSKISKRDYVAYQNWLVNTNGNSPARVRRLKATVSSMSNFVEAILDDEEEFMNFRSAIKKVESPANVKVREKTVFTDEMLETLLNVLVERKQYEKACMLALAMGSGRRKAELPRFKVSYFDDENIMYGSLYKTPEKIKTKGRGTGKYINCYTMSKIFKPYFDLWMKERERLGIKSEWLFPNPANTDEHIPVSTLNSWADSFSRMMGMSFYWHAVRHYTTTHLLRLGLPSEVVQQLFAWDSLEMVRVYDDRETEELFSKYFNEDGVVQVENKSIIDL